MIEYQYIQFTVCRYYSQKLLIIINLIYLTSKKKKEKRIFIDTISLQYMNIKQTINKNTHKKIIFSWFFFCPV